MRTQEQAHDAFEHRLREALDQYEVPYNSADWAQMEKALGAKGTLGGRARWSLAALLGGGLIIGGAAWYQSANTPEPLVVSGESHGGLALENRTDGPGEPSAAPVSNDPRMDVDMVAPERKADEDAPTVSSISVQPGAVGIASGQPQGARAELNASVQRNAQASAERTDARGGGLVDMKTAPSVANDKEQRTFRASVSQACAGTSVDFKVEHMPENGIYLWNFGDGSFSNKANPEHTFSKPGRYQVMLSMSSAGGGLIQNKPSSDVIVIHEAPKAAFNVVRQEYEGHLPSVHFENRSLGGAKYHWDFGDGQTSDIAHPDHIYKKQGTYRVELTITNPIGCEDKLMKEVLVAKDYNLDAPANFSPDGDGHEDTFMPAALQKLGVKFTLSIYDLNGNLMYETKDATLPWSGKAQNRGELCPAGAYAWVVDVSESLHLAETYTGKVQLIR